MTLVANSVTSLLTVLPMGRSTPSSVASGTPAPLAVISTIKGSITSRALRTFSTKWLGSGWNCQHGRARARPGRGM